MKALFLEALEYSGPDRAAFLAGALGGDTDLKREVEALLASHAMAGSFCETPAAGLLDPPEADGPPLRLAVGTRLGVYEITGFIAAGGMGAVYRGRHTVLGRDVAIKTVSTGAAVGARVRRRLIREARHASLLTHPNICAIYDVGEAEGLPFIVMEYIGGRTLEEIVRGNPPPLRTALKYAADIAAALEHAHERGIVHRDLKSSNVAVNDAGRAVVLDFGLARRLPAAIGSVRPESLTIDAFAGTLSHMAPELLRGEEADVRSDVWSFGVLLYELLTGELPFSGHTQFETTSAILGDPPKPPSAHIQLALRLIIERCLIKDPRLRYQAARDIRQDIEAVGRGRSRPLAMRLLIARRRRALRTVAFAGIGVAALGLGAQRLHEALVAPRIDTLAVLPLENATGDSAAAYYVAGVTDAIISRLGSVSDVRVFTRAPVTSGTDRTASPSVIGTALGADAVVRGRLRRPGDSVAIDVDVVRSSDGRTLWSGSYQRSERGVLALEDDVVRGVASAIRATLPSVARDPLTAARAVSPDVYEAYLEGRYEWNRRRPESLLRAIEHFERAVALDPTYAPAHAALADCYNQLGTVMVGEGSPSAYRPLAAREAIRALQIDPNSAEAHAALGYAWHYELRWTDAERELRRAIELNPNFALARAWYANLLMSQGRMREALRQVYAARDMDPFSLVVNTNVGWVLYYSGRHSEAIAQLEHTLTLDSSYVQAHWRLADALTAEGRVAEARRHIQRVESLGGSPVQALSALASFEASIGEQDSARALLRELISRASHQYVPPAAIALPLARLGEIDRAVFWMEKALLEKSNAVAYLAVEPAWSRARGDPRYESLLARAGQRR